MQSQWTFEQACGYIDTYAGRGWRLGLDRMEALMRAPDLYEFAGRDGRCQFLHVAGTNGKGSTTAMIEALLSANGYSAGATYSPYVVNVRERIRIGNRNVSEERFAEAAQALAPVAESIGATDLGLVTEFEFKTAMAFWVWRQEQCQWVACEVGLGGRLDATNVLMPAACAIVSIGMDHMQFLGDSLEAIAREKAGILKPGKIGVVGAIEPGPLAAITEVACDVEAPLWQLGLELHHSEYLGREIGWLATPARTRTEIQAPPLGPMSLHNAMVAVATLDAAGIVLTQEQIQLGLRATKILGRFQHVALDGVDVLLDGAHNAASAHHLARAVRARFPDQPIHCLFGMLEGHEVGDVFGPLSSIVARTDVSPINFHRSRRPSDLADEIAGMSRHPVNAHDDFAIALSNSLDVARAHGAVIVITGSFYLVGEALQHFSRAFGLQVD